MRLIIFMTIFTFFLCSSLNAQETGDNKGPLFAMRKPIDLDYGAYPLLFVTFNHSTHKSVKCRLCHHKASNDGNRFIACTSSGCHNLPGPRERVKNSMFMAYHAPTKDRSCYGCHSKEAAEHPSFKGCQPCHGGPQQLAQQK